MIDILGREVRVGDVCVIVVAESRSYLSVITKITHTGGRYKWEFNAKSTADTRTKPHMLIGNEPITLQWTPSRIILIPDYELNKKQLKDVREIRNNNVN